MALSRNKSTIQKDVIKQGTEPHKAMEAERSAIGKSSNRKSGKNKIKQCAALENLCVGKACTAVIGPANKHKFTKAIS